MKFNEPFNGRCIPPGTTVDLIVYRDSATLLASSFRLLFMLEIAMKLFFDSRGSLFAFFFFFNNILVLEYIVGKEKI